MSGAPTSEVSRRRDRRGVRLRRAREPRGGGDPRGVQHRRAREPGGRDVILEVRAIDTYYSLGHILHNLSLTVGEGEVVALLGRNGAGKTPTLRSITGLPPPRH